jgi:hypothetical protein
MYLIDYPPMPYTDIPSKPEHLTSIITLSVQSTPRTARRDLVNSPPLELSETETHPGDIYSTQHTHRPRVHACYFVITARRRVGILQPPFSINSFPGILQAGSHMILFITARVDAVFMMC